MLAITVNTDRQSAPSATSTTIDRHWDASNLKRLVARRRRGIPNFIDSPELRSEHDNVVLGSDLAISAFHFRF